MRPALLAVPGFSGGTLLERLAGDNNVEITVQTRWTSFDAIRAFAGSDFEEAVVEPTAKVVLRTYDHRVTHHEVVVEVPSV